MATFVLVHGAYQGGWIWRDVVSRLRADGHAVFAPTLDGCNERAGALRPGITNTTHAHELAQLLFYEDLRDVVLVGTSCGGMVISEAAEQVRDRIARLVLVDALGLRDGESLGDFVARPLAIGNPLAVGLPQADIVGRLFRDFDPALREWAAARTTLHPREAMEGRMVLKSFWQQRWTADVIWCRRSPNPPLAHQRRTADMLQAAWHEIDTGHYPMLSAPDELARMIQQRSAAT